MIQDGHRTILIAKDVERLKSHNNAIGRCKC